MLSCCYTKHYRRSPSIKECRKESIISIWEDWWWHVKMTTRRVTAFSRITHFSLFLFITGIWEAILAKLWQPNFILLFNVQSKWKLRRCWTFQLIKFVYYATILSHHKKKEGSCCSCLLRYAIVKEKLKNCQRAKRRRHLENQIWQQDRKIRQMDQ